MKISTGVKLIINGKETLTIKFDKDGNSITDLGFSDYFRSLPKNEKIALLEDYRRTVQEDIELFKEPRRLKNITFANINTGKKSDPNNEFLILWSIILKALIASLRDDVLLDKPDDLFKAIKFMTFKRN